MSGPKISTHLLCIGQAEQKPSVLPFLSFLPEHQSRMSVKVRVSKALAGSGNKGGVERKETLPLDEN